MEGAIRGLTGGDLLAPATDCTGIKDTIAALVIEGIS